MKELDALVIKGPRSLRGQVAIVGFWFQGIFLITGLLISRPEGRALSQEFDVIADIQNGTI